MQTDRNTGRQAGRQGGTQADKQTERKAQRQIALKPAVTAVRDFLIFDFAMVGFVLGGVLEIFKILLPRLGSGWVSRFFFNF